MNPLFQSSAGPNNKTAPSNGLNNAAPSVRHTFNRFNNGYTNYTTANYGEYTPFFNQVCNPADRKKFKSMSQIRTLTLNSPLYSRMKMNKDYFFVPNDAILPINWQKIYRNPSQGDDVPDDVNTIIPDIDVIIQFADKFLQALKFFTDGANTSKPEVLVAGKFLLRSFPLMDAFFSSSGILSRLGYNLSHVISFLGANSVYLPTWDRFAEQLYPNLFSVGTFPFSFDSGNLDYRFHILDTDNLMNIAFPNEITISPKDAMAYFRYFIDSIDNPANSSAFKEYLISLHSHIASLGFNEFTVKSIMPEVVLESQNKVFNYDQCVAYNLICAQFYSNGNVDAIYNAELYRDMLGSHIHIFNDGFDTFVYNGINTQYDMASGHYMKKAFQVITTILFDETAVTKYPKVSAALDYLRNIFCLQNSLKYGDYFTGSHTRPLAVGDVTAPVVGNSVSAIDVTKAIAYQRFLNVVVKLKNNFADYLRSLFGTLPTPDYHEAKFVSHSEGSVDGFEVANTTTADQGNLVTLLHSVNENFEFELECDMPGIAMGIVSFVSSRAYCQTKDRMFMRRDRYDMFNPMLQTIGDQPILGFEKNSLYSTPYGYVQRYMEYKQRYNIASGAFDDSLKSYCIICDSPTSSANSLELISPNVNSVSIRLTPRELDRYFKNQSAWSYGNSFHFICEFDNQCDDVREADYTPTIL